MTGLDRQVVSGGGPLPTASANARGRWTHRPGLLLVLRDGAGHVGRGEASPLPGYSPDDLDLVRHALESVDAAPLALDPALPIAPQLATCSAQVPERCPAARFAIESAALDLLGQQLDRPAWSLLRDEHRGPPGPLPLTALLAGGPRDAVLAQARAAVARGITSLKLKVGPQSELPRQLASLSALREALPAEVRIRLDANRSLDPQTALAFMRDVAPLSPEFLEEPADDLRALGDSAVPIALDESLQWSTAEDDIGWVAAQLPLRAVVLKPMALGGIARCLRLADVARRLHVSVVVSHLMDGPVALAACAALALVANTAAVAAGLDRHPGLAAWRPVPLPFLDPAVLSPTGAPGLGLGPWPE